ncbi:selenium-dependent molybdenum cofactor biosynthesis protein YqeB [Collinsella sp. An2]|uniref:selenium-dependent molybdenum cofactor biosynthesis protein YqeB n=1 Tax=Collinsella sp. An2 TaxID=1965585 RepID=UPI000B375F33|nr:selenium-dependent molybdenum cofactor biosynthesis protein YqeB [Collinsella sp. An2]OUP08706.1 molybdenum hydroxylase [Collinsella sp. An2]
MLVVVRGAGDLATGIAVRLHAAGCRVVMCDIARPTTVRRTVAFSEAIRLGTMEVEGVRARFAADVDKARAILAKGEIAVLVDPDAACVSKLSPDALVDAILAKRNLGTHITDAPAVVGVGPGFTAGLDCHAVVETKRGHYLGRVIWEGSAIPNTGVPGIIAGHGADRVLRAPAEGRFEPVREIGDVVHAGDVAATVAGIPMTCTIDGVLRGLLAPGVSVTPGMKAGDIDPRGVVEHCFSVSDKARAVGGGVLEAVLALTGALRG